MFGICVVLIKLKCGCFVLLIKLFLMKLKLFLKIVLFVFLVLLVFLSRMIWRIGVKFRNCLKVIVFVIVNCVWKWGLVRKSVVMMVFLVLLIIFF